MAKHFFKKRVENVRIRSFAILPPRSGACRSSDTRSPRASLFYFKKYVAMLIFQIKLQNKQIPKSHPIPCPMQVRGNNCRTRSVAAISDLWWQMLKLLLMIWILIWNWFDFDDILRQIQIKSLPFPKFRNPIKILKFFGFDLDLSDLMAPNPIHCYLVLTFSFSHEFKFCFFYGMLNCPAVQGTYILHIFG
jgi:hypothetical protein